MILVFQYADSISCLSSPVELYDFLFTFCWDHMLIILQKMIISRV